MAHESSDPNTPHDATRSSGPTRTEEQVIPVVAEELDVETIRVRRGTVRVHTRIETHDEVVDYPVVSEEVVIEHVAVNAVVEGERPEPHHEGDVLVIPILEEVVVVEKRLMLRELVRVTKRRTTSSAQETVTLRREVVDVERVEGETP